MARQITDTWQRSQKGPLPFVIGQTWLAGTVAIHSPDQPKVLIDARTQRSPGVRLEDVLGRGGVFVWDTETYKSTHVPGHLTQLFKSLTDNFVVSIQPVIVIDWLRLLPVPSPDKGGPPALAPKRIGWAILVPANTLNNSQ